MLLCLRSTVIDKMTVLDSMAIRAHKSNVIEFIILSVAVFVVKAENFWVSTTINRYSYAI